MRLMGLDYGSKTVGVSAVDALGITVVPVETIWRKEENKLRRTCARIEELITWTERKAKGQKMPAHLLR